MGPDYLFHNTLLLPEINPATFDMDKWNIDTDHWRDRHAWLPSPSVGGQMDLLIGSGMIDDCWEFIIGV